MVAGARARPRGRGHHRSRRSGRCAGEGRVAGGDPAGGRTRREQDRLRRRPVDRWRRPGRAVLGRPPAPRAPRRRAADARRPRGPPLGRGHHARPRRLHRRPRGRRPAAPARNRPPGAHGAAAIRRRLPGSHDGAAPRPPRRGRRRRAARRPARWLGDPARPSGRGSSMPPRARRCTSRSSSACSATTATWCRRPGRSGPRCRAPTSVTVPPTVKALLAARLEGLPEDERNVARRASVIGRSFEVAALGALDADAVHRTSTGASSPSCARSSCVPTGPSSPWAMPSASATC